MLITNLRWGKIRNWFTEEEKLEFRNAIIKKLPKSNRIDLLKLKNETREKLLYSCGVNNGWADRRYKYLKETGRIEELERSK